MPSKALRKTTFCRGDDACSPRDVEPRELRFSLDSPGGFQGDMKVGISWPFGPRADVTKSRNASFIQRMSGFIGFASFLDPYCSAEKRRKNDCGVLVHQDVGRSALHIPNPANVRMDSLDTRNDIQAPLHNPSTVVHHSCANLLGLGITTLQTHDRRHLSHIERSVE